jgi:YVTN family beta-propeller protein
LIYAGKVGTGWLTIIDTARHAVLSTLAIGSNPETVTASPDGAHLYITHHDKASVSVVEPASNKITTVAVDDARSM